MYASVTERDMNVRAARTYVFVSVLVALFGAFYEHYSFGVYSYWMIYAFAVPLAFGAVPALMLATTKRVSRLPAITRKLWHAGIAVWTVGSIYTGVLAIYGTDSSWSAVYAAAGCALLSVAAITAVFRKQE